MDSLQFQKAEFPNTPPTCAFCKGLIADQYYKIGGRVACDPCARHIDGIRSRQPALLRGAVFGAGAALGCAIVYAVIIAFSGLELALVAILVGYLVGRAARIGAGGIGGRSLQIVAVVLTYVAITASSALLVLPRIHATPLQIAALAPQLLGVALVSPFLSLREGIGGILSIAILGFGLFQAWRQTAPFAVSHLGPFQVGE